MIALTPCAAGVPHAVPATGVVLAGCIVFELLQLRSRLSLPLLSAALVLWAVLPAVFYIQRSALPYGLMHTTPTAEQRSGFTTECLQERGHESRHCDDGAAKRRLPVRGWHAQRFILGAADGAQLQAVLDAQPQQDSRRLHVCHRCIHALLAGRFPQQQQRNTINNRHIFCLQVATAWPLSAIQFVVVMGFVGDVLVRRTGGLMMPRVADGSYHDAVQ